MQRVVDQSNLLNSARADLSTIQKAVRKDADIEIRRFNNEERRIWDELKAASSTLYTSFKAEREARRSAELTPIARRYGQVKRRRLEVLFFFILMYHLFRQLRRKSQLPDLM